MRGRFRFLDASYVDELAIAKSRNPYYRENPPGVANEPIERPVAFGLIDFFLYVLIIYPIAAANQALFLLWVLTIPFAFLSAVMPVGPVSAAYWSRVRTREKPARPLIEEGVFVSLRARRQWLQELAVESVKVESELRKELENAGDLRFAFETQIRQAQETRAHIGKEIAKIDAQLDQIEVLNNL